MTNEVVLEDVCIMLHDCSPQGIKYKKDKYDVVDNEGIVLFTGTANQCKKQYPNYIRPKII